MQRLDAPTHESPHITQKRPHVTDPRSAGQVAQDHVRRSHRMDTTIKTLTRGLVSQCPNRFAGEVTKDHHDRPCDIAERSPHIGKQCMG